MEEMERLLSVWIDHQSQINMPISTLIIQEKAKSLHEDLVAKYGESSQSEPFLASKGWFDRFKKRHSLHNLKTTGEAASADTQAAKLFPEDFKKIVDAGGYTPQQVYNVDETGLFWKKMPSRTFISKEEKTASGFKAAKDRITLLVGGNAAGDHKLKPLLIYHAENPRAFKGINKSTLDVIWRSNKRGWMTTSVFEDWLNNHFSTSVTKFNAEQNIANKALLIVDNAPSHKFGKVPEHIKIIFLPPNTTPLLQPMDQGVISNFKAYYLRRVFRSLIESIDGPNQETIKEFWKKFNIMNAINNIVKSWDEVTESAMNGVWMKLWPECVQDHTSASSQLSNVDVQNQIVAIAHEAGMNEVDSEDIVELLQCNDEDLTNEELLMLLEERCDLEKSETPGESPQITQTQKLSRAISLIEEGLDIFKEIDPLDERSRQVTRLVQNDILCYREIYKEKVKSKQTSLDSYLTNSTFEAQIKKTDKGPLKPLIANNVNKEPRKKMEPEKPTPLLRYFSKTAVLVPNAHVDLTLDGSSAERSRLTQFFNNLK